MAYLNGQQKTIEHAFGTITEIVNQNFILMKSDEAVSQRDWICDREEGSSENKGKTDMSYVKEETVLGWRRMN